MPDASDGTTEERILEALDRAVARLEENSRRQTSVVFAQLEALLWLRDMLHLDQPLPPTRGWAASPDLLLAVARRIADSRPAAIVELGSGTSSVVMAACLRNQGAGRLVSIEHEPAHAARTRLELERHGLTEFATVLDAPLGDVTISAGTWRWYTVPMDRIPDRIDMLFVDGPPGGTWDLARYPALPVFADRMAAIASIFVDDGIRRDEREIVARWAREYPTFTAEAIPSEKEAWLLYR